MTDTRSSSALFKRAEQLKRWEESDTNKHSPSPKSASRIKFSPSVVFLSACTSGEKKEVQRLLKLGADINTANTDGLTALHQLCIDDNLDMVEFLVARGADVNRGDNEGWTPLHVTASCGHISIARYLIDNGADVAAVNCDGHLPIDITESADMEKMLQKVIDEKGIDCEKSRNAEVDHLIREVRNWAVNGYVDVHDPKTGGTPLHVAAAKGYLEVLKILLEECNVDLDCVDYDGWTPLHAAALWGQKEAAAMLLQHGADPTVKNFMNQTCLDLVDPSNSTWLSEAIQSRRVNNKNKRKARPPRHDTIKRDKSLATPNENALFNNKTTPNPEIICKAPEGKPPKGRPASPEIAEEDSKNVSTDESLAWRRLSYRMAKQPEKDTNAVVNNEPDNDTILRRTRSFETDKNFYQRYRDVTARIRASSCPSITPQLQQPPASPTPAPAHPKTNNASENTNEGVQARINPLQKNHSSPDTVPNKVRSCSAESVETNSSNSTPSAATPTKLSPGNIFKNFFKSFVPPVRDEESETQRKAHAKRVRETRRSTQGVTLDELKSAEQFVKKKTAGNGKKTGDESETDAACGTGVAGGDVAVTLALACATTTATATIAANTERRPSWRLRLDPANKFELEDEDRRPSPPSSADAVVTLMLRRPPAGSDANTTSPPTASEETRTGDEEKDCESNKSSSSSNPASAQAALSAVQRRRRPKRRSTGVGHVDIDDIVNDRGRGGEGDADSESVQSGSERTNEVEEPDYKALYEASEREVRRLRALLANSEMQLSDARTAITTLTQMSQNSTSELNNREKRAIERKLSEMEEELKQLQKLKAENERLRAENRALTRVVSKLTNSAAK